MPKNNQHLLIFCLLLLTTYQMEAATWWVYFRDKGAASARMDIPEDHPVYSPYVQALVQAGVRVRAASRWLNAVSIEADAAGINRLYLIAGVEKVEPLIGAGHTRAVTRTEVPPARLDTLQALVTRQMNLDALARAGLNGKGVRIAVLDAGFEGADIHPAFDSLRAHGQIVATRDFFSGGNNVYRHSDHGTQVLACMGGWFKGRPLGAATGAEYLLARVEHERREKAIEEDYWIAALEWADSLGADIVNSSVAFMRPRYRYEDMNGLTAPASRAANVAAARGMVVVCAMGNEGSDKWHYMGAPADAPTVLSVGGTMPMPKMRIKFSSFGPNAAGHPKPDVAAPAFVVAPHRTNQWREAAGTSFASPLVAGFAACLLQHSPGLRGGALFQAVRLACHRYPFYDYEIGYGVPDANRFLFPENDTLRAPLFQVGFARDTVVITLDSARLAADPFARDYGQPLSVHLESRPGILKSAFTVRLAADQKQFVFLLENDHEGLLRIWMGGCLWEKKFP